MPLELRHLVHSHALIPTPTEFLRRVSLLSEEDVQSGRLHAAFQNYGTILNAGMTRYKFVDNLEDEIVSILSEQPEGAAATNDSEEVTGKESEAQASTPAESEE